MERRNDEKQDLGIFGVSERASLWILAPRVALGILISTALMFALFWLRFGQVNGYVALVATILAAFQILLVVGLRHHSVSASPVRPAFGGYDRIGAFWLVAVFFGAFFAWFTNDWADRHPEYATLLHITTVFLSIVLPIVTSIPNYRFVTSSNAYITVPMLVTVTLLPSIVGFNSAGILCSSILN